MLQWHSDAQRQATLEDWAIERMIAIYSYRNPQQKGTIADLVRVFASSKYLPIHRIIVLTSQEQDMFDGGGIHTFAYVGSST